MRRGLLQKNEWLLVHGAAGGVGLAAVDLGKYLGAKIIATASSDEKLALIEEKFAPEAVINVNDGFREKVKELTGGGAPPPVNSLTFSRKPSLTFITASGANFSSMSASFSSEEAVAMILAPKYLPKSTAAKPTPPAAPCTSSHSFFCKSPRRTRPT